mmetsp:Transcript_19717/g.56361  ORF Transcript_19717/g.56361 Transcript_19717/m.56361 type:complete len:171 (+) Transcript_19717:640-1152(+)
MAASSTPPSRPEGQPEGFLERVQNDAVSRIVARTFAAGVAGATMGGLLSAWRDASSALYIGAMGTNYILLGASYFGTLEAARYAFPAYDGRYELHLGTGLAMGSVVGGVFAGPRKIVPGALLFAGLGVGGFFASERLGAWRADKARRIAEEYRRRELLERAADGQPQSPP